MDRSLRFISLGGDCQPGAHIRRFSGEPDITGVFDWLECSLEAVNRIIALNFADFFRPENLFWEWKEESWLVTDRLNNIASWHHYKSQEPEHIEQVGMMFRMLGKRFMAMLKSDVPVVFVRRWITADGPNCERKAKQLFDILRATKPDSVMLYLQEHDPRPPFVMDRYISVFNPSRTLSAKWEGYNALYDRNFARAIKVYEETRHSGAARAAE